MKESDRIFTFHPDTISSYFSSFLKKNNLPKASIHSLRHGNISLQLYMGIDPKTASVRAGHSNVRRNNAGFMHICKNQQIGLLRKNWMKHYHSILIISILKEKEGQCTEYIALFVLFILFLFLVFLCFFFLCIEKS